jgi:hypothetical protein
MENERWNLTAHDAIFDYKYTLSLFSTVLNIYQEGLQLISATCFHFCPSEQQNAVYVTAFEII